MDGQHQETGKIQRGRWRSENKGQNKWDNDDDDIAEAKKMNKRTAKMLMTEQ